VHRSSNLASGTVAPVRPKTQPWWLSAAVYRVDVTTFADGNADGVGDLAGLRERLGYLSLLGVDAISLTGLLGEPAESGATAGIAPGAGTLPDLDGLLVDAHEQGLKVLLELTNAAGSGPDLERIARFWLDRGIDGVRLDADQPADNPGNGEPPEADVHSTRLRRVLDEYPGRVFVATGSAVPAGPQLRVLQALNNCGWDATALTAAVTNALAGGADDSAEKGRAWQLSGPDGARPATRYGGGPGGAQRARAAALMQLALPGAQLIWAGDELGLPDVQPEPATGPRPGELLDRSDGSPIERADIRSANGIPIPWSGEKPPYEFTTEDETSPPMPEGWADLTVENQLEDAASTLSVYRRALELRRSHSSASGDGIEWYGAPVGCLAFRRTGGLVCAVNTTGESVPLPPGEPILCSAPILDGQLPANAAAWLA